MPIIDVMKLRREIDEVKKEMRAICDSALARDTKAMTDDEGALYLKLEGRASSLKQEIELAERNNALEVGSIQDTPTQDARDDGNMPPANQRFATFGENLNAIIRACQPNGFRDSRLQVAESRAQGGMGEDTGSGGGYLVQTDFVTGLMKRVYEGAVLAGRCKKLSIGANSNGVSWNEIDESSRATGYRWGGTRAYWVASGTAVTASNLKFSKRKLDLEKIMSIVRVTDELMQDATALGNLVSETVSQEIAFQLDDAILRGTGAGMPLGILNSDSIVSVAKESGQSADSVVYENLIKMRARMWGKSRANSVWFINQDIEPELQTMALVVGVSGVPVYMPATGISGLPYDTLFGRPIIPIEQASTLGDVGDIGLFDLSQYLLIDKGGIRKDVSMHVYFTTDEQALRFVLRINGMPLWSSQLTPANGANTLSPFITLAERA